MSDEFNLKALPAAVQRWAPEFGIVLGSGFGRLIESLGAAGLSIPYTELPGIPPSTVPGHPGRFVFAEIGARRCVIAQGRSHLYEGRTAREVAAAVRFMAALGIRTLVLTNAAGTLHPEFLPGGWMLLTDHLNLTGTSPLVGEPRFIDMSEVYSQRMRRAFAKAARAEGIALHEGVYAGLLGPQYETPAEIRMLRHLGADAVGMSTVLEAIQARALALEVAGISSLTNWAAGLGKTPLTHEEVLAAGNAAAKGFMRLLERTLREG